VVTFDDFKTSLAQASPPADLTVPLQALWWAGKDDWARAHELVMGSNGVDAAWVHAYLHRVEGDLPNARYWYRQAKREPAANALDGEWEEISSEMLAR
jgi:hypothetical protein